MKKNVLRAIAGAALAAALLAAAWHFRRTAASPAAEYRVTAREVGVLLPERGILATADTLPVDVKVTGEILEIAKSGVRMREGDLVARLECTEQMDRLEGLKVNLESAKADRDVSQAELALAQTEETNRRELLKAKLAFAQLDLQQARVGLTPEDRRLLVIDREIARLDAQDADDELARQQRLFEKGFLSASLLDTYREKAASAHARRDEAALRIALREKAFTPEQILELEKEVERLQGLLARGEKATQRRLELIQAQIRTGDARIERDQYGVSRLTREIGQTTLTAPGDGVFVARLFQDWRSGGVWMEYKPGQQVWKNDRIGDIIHPAVMNVSIMIHEADVDRVRTGMPARVRLQAYPDRTFPGALREFGGLGRDRFDVAPQGQEDGQTGVTVFNGLVSVESGGVEFRPGMSALVELVLASPVRCLVLPRAAVRPAEPAAPGAREARAFRVSRKSLWGAREVRIRGRILDAHNIIVEDGLQEGDVVLDGREEGS